MLNRQVYEIMSQPVLTVRPTATLLEAQALMEEHKIRRLPVVSVEGELVGIISRSDVREGVAVARGLNPYDLKVSEVEETPVELFMTSEPMTVESQEPVGLAAELMLKRRVGALPVLENGVLVGIITESDIFRMVAEMWREEQQS